MKKQRWFAILLCIILCMTIHVPSISAASYTVLETDVSTPSTGCTMLGVYGTYYSNAEEALARINEIRKEACEDGNVPDPRDSSRMLQPSDYVPIKWSTDLERNARIRAVEGGLCFGFMGSGHNRLNGKSWSSIKYNSVSTYGENLAYNYDKNALGGIEQWYDEKSTWVNQGSGVTGHYTSMINPRFTYVGLGDFYTTASKYPNTLAAEFSMSTASLTQTMLPAQENVMQKIEVKDSYISYVLDGNDLVYLGESITLEPKATLTNSSNGKTLSLWVIDSVTYTSSDTSVATVSTEGVVTGKAKGSTTITVKANGTAIASKVITSSCKHNKTLLSTVPATCTKTGSNTFSCSKCNETFTETLPLAPHNYEYGEADSSGKATGVCTECNDTLTITPPTSFSIYWRNSTSSSSSYFSAIPSSNPKNSSILAWLYSINGDSDYQDFTFSVSDESILSPYKSGSDYAFKVLQSGIVTLKAYPVYNPAIGKTYTLRVGDAGDIDIADTNITLSQTNYSYDGSAKKPTVSITYQGATLTQNTDYTVSYSDNIACGTATVLITGKGIFGKTTSKSFTISGIDIKNATATLSESSYEYDGTEKKPTVTVKYGSKTLVKDTDYTVTYSDNKEIGTATVTITGTGNYSGTIEKTFKITHTTHTPKIVSAVLPTCTTTGLTEGSVCSVCGETINEQKIVPALGHDYKATFSWNKDCSDCTVSFVCANDNSHVIENADCEVTIKQTSSINPTCTKDGSITYTASCEYEGNQYSDTQTVTVSAAGHDYIPTYNWSEDGTSCTLCFVCKHDSNHVLPDIEMDMTHIQTKAATCTITGLCEYTATCTYEGETYTDTKEVITPIDPDNHSDIVTDEKVNATCTTEGKTEGSHCDACDTIIKKQVVIPSTGHNYLTSFDWSGDYETCDFVLTCKNDNKHIEKIEAAVTSETTPATEEADGSIVYTASADYNGTTYTDTKTIVLEYVVHTYIPTYTWSDDGTSCKLSLECEDDETLSISNVTMTVRLRNEVEETCETAGSKTYLASYNYKGTVFKDTKIITTPALGHDYVPNYIWSDDSKMCTMIFLCSRHESFWVDSAEIPMTVVKSSSVEPTCTKDGSITYTASCEYEGKTYTDTNVVTISALKHDYKPIYTWSEDGSICKLSLSCKHDNSHNLSGILMTVTSKDIKKATCMSTGTRTYTATYTYDGKTYTDTNTVQTAINPDNHTNVIIDKRVEATCTKTGQTEGSHCEDCHTVIVEQKLINLKRCSYSNIISEESLEYPATFKCGAIYNKTCVNCGRTIGGGTFVGTKPLVITYHTHIQTLGDSQPVKKNGEMAGTSGMAKRLENIWIKVNGVDNLGIQYTTHCQTYGWMPWSSNGEPNGTSGESKRLEAIKIRLTGSAAKYYDIYYRVHAQSYGWLDWACNGAPSGTAGYAKRLEGIQIVIVPKGSEKPGIKYADVDASKTAHSNQSYIDKNNTEIKVPGYDNAPNITYRTHVQSYGWQEWKHNGEVSGTSGEAKRLEAINIKISNRECTGDIEYKTHIQTYGWEQSWKKNGQMSGTSGQAKRLEAIQIRLTGEMSQKYDIYYRVHAQSFGWLNWAKNGEPAGTAGYGKRLEGIQIVLVPKGQKGPGISYGNIVSKQNSKYIQR